MPTWGNTDVVNQKPKFDLERTTREVLQLTTANTTISGNTIVTLVYNDGAGNNVANIGVSIGQYVYIAGQGTTSTAISSNGYPGFFSSNNTVASISGNNVTLTTGVKANVAGGVVIEFDKAIAWRGNRVANTYNQDTILVTASRAANGNNAIAPTGNFSAGWVHIQKKTNNDGTVRYLKETLVALANATASNTSSGNTSFGSVVTGV
jgi:hypothetical protein